MTLELAKFTPKTQDGGDGESFDVHFNPASLDYTITNTLQGGNGGRRRAQFVSQSSGKLTMELLFDTTHNGEDVRKHTEKVAKLMEPGGEEGSSRRPPTIAKFEWGAYKFEGLVESFREKIDFFSEDGVPLRATVNLTLARQDKVFDFSARTDILRSTQGETLNSSESTVEARLGSGDNLFEYTPDDDSDAEHEMASDNGFESIRSPGAAVVRLGDEVPLAPPVTFSAGGGGGGFGVGGSFGAAAGLDIDFGVSASIGGGLDVGLDLGLEAGVQIGVNAGVNFGAAIGASASASVLAGIDIRVAGASDASGIAGSLLKSTGDLGGSSAPSGASGAAGGGSAAGGASRPGSPGSKGSSSGRKVPLGMKTKISQPVSAGIAQQAGPNAPSLNPPSAQAAQEAGIVSAGVPAVDDPFAALTQNKGFRRHKRLDPASLVRSVEARGYGTGASVGFRIGGQATMLGEASVAADVGREVRFADRIRFDRGTRGSGR